MVISFIIGRIDTPLMMTRIPDPHPILKLGHAFQGARALLSAVELGVFSALADGPLDRDALQQRVGINQRGTRDFLDSLVALGMLTRDDDGLYRNTIESDYYLDRSKPTYIGAVLENFGTRNYAVWSGRVEPKLTSTQATIILSYILMRRS